MSRCRCAALISVIVFAMTLISTSVAAFADDRTVEELIAETNNIEEQQQQLDAANRPETIAPSSAESEFPESIIDDQSSVQSFADTPTTQASNDMSLEGTQPYGLMTNLLESATAVDRNHVTFSWKNSGTTEQTRYRITVYKGINADQANLVYTGPWVSGTQQTSVQCEGLSQSLEDNALYSWQVEVEYMDGTVAQSASCVFATAVGSAFESTDFIWTGAEDVSALVRASVNGKPDICRALLTVTALDTEASLRHVYNVYVNGTEIGVGPNRRAGNAVYYNTFDITRQLTEGRNIIGLFGYSPAKATGVLIQLTYHYADGSQEVAYNSAIDSNATQIRSMDAVVYGTSNASIGTGYYTEYAQNANVTRFPFAWQTAADFDGNPWGTPSVFPLASVNANYSLTPAITANTTRRIVAASSIQDRGNGTYTVTFPKEIIGDVQLTVSTPNDTAVKVRITEGEELDNGVARFHMRTGNTYEETWTFAGQNVTFTGYSLRAFRYVTVYNYPGTLTKDLIHGVETTIPTTVTDSIFSSNNALLQSISDLTMYTWKETSIDTVSDSVTRERRPYEGDNLIYQDLTYAVGGDPLPARNTWNWLMAHPSQYTEYRLMTILGVYADYRYTGDTDYVRSVYPKLQSLLQTVTLNPSIGLVSRTGSTVDLVDWPRTETSGFDFDNTLYKTVINAIACEAYTDMAQLASALGNANDAETYNANAQTVKTNMISRLYNASNNRYRDGLTSSGAAVNHYAPQNSYVALAYEIYSDQNMANALASTMTANNKQTGGSIYAAYFFYKGLYLSGNGDKATSILAKTDSDVRTYNTVINGLNATITPEAWSVFSKSNMTFSHAWGSGGGIGMLAGMAGVSDWSANDGTLAVQALGRANDDITHTVGTMRGDVTVTVSRHDNQRDIQITVPGATRSECQIPQVDENTRITVDGISWENQNVASGIARITLASGSHSIQVIDAQGDSGESSVPPNSGSGFSSGDSLAVRRGRMYYFKNSIAGGEADSVIAYGRPDDQVLVGDWDGDGVDTLVVRRGRMYYFKNSIAGGEADSVIAYGRPDDQVLVGDWDGESTDTLCVRRGQTYYFKNSIAGGEADSVIVYGRAADKVLVGDWNNDAVDTLAVRRGPTYYFKNSIAGGEADAVIVYGRANDDVLAGNWDGK